MGTEDLVTMIEGLVRGGRTPAQAGDLLSRQLDAGLVKAAVVEYEKRVGRIRQMDIPPAMVRPDLESWYAGPGAEDIYWPSLLDYLQKKPWNNKEGIISDLDSSSTRIVSLLGAPGAAKIRTRGLVLGYVQSGKTTNFTAVISKAADAGYKLFIVLSGTTNSLRRQTQERLARDIVSLNDSWITLTTVERDFEVGDIKNANAFLTDNANQKTLCVVKKNSTRLGYLRKWLKAARQEILSACPVLVIDDEADQASLNTSSKPDERKGINKQLIGLLSQLPKAAYVGYTATPFANVFVDPEDPEDLYPRDFIVDLPRPKGYFGPERLFGRDRLSPDEPAEVTDGLDMIRQIVDDEIPFLQPASANDRFTFVPTVTSSLRRSLVYFWMATAARRRRGQEAEHSTMLIHTSGYQAVHQNYLEPIQRVRDEIKAGLATRNGAVRDELARIWEEETERVPASSLGRTKVPFDELLPDLPDVLTSCDIIIENSSSMVRLDYEGGPKIYIVIGGNVLSRGLTLEGLTVSFFIRFASAYDTLLQMGRWFGYRLGYEDLPRIWMTAELERNFFDMATVEQEIRQDIARYELEKLTPLDVAVRIRTHPSLSITSKLKMQHAVTCQASYSERFVQTIHFDPRAGDILKGNLKAGRSLLGRVAGRYQAVERNGSMVFRDVPVDWILEFLAAYTPHERGSTVRPDLLRKYIVAQNESTTTGPSLRLWNVVAIGNDKNDYGNIDLGLPRRLNMVNRSQLNLPQGDSYADIKALISRSDLLEDLELEASARKELVGAGYPAIMRFRTERLPDRGLLALYPINRMSAPAGRTKTSPSGVQSRRALDAVEDVLGMALAFPRSNDLSPQEYLSVDLSGVKREDIEWVE